MTEKFIAKSVTPEQMYWGNESNMLFASEVTFERFPRNQDEYSVEWYQDFLDKEEASIGDCTTEHYIEDISIFRELEEMVNGS